MVKIYSLFLFILSISYMFLYGILIGIENHYNNDNIEILSSHFLIMISFSSLISFVSILPSVFIYILKELKYIR